MSPLVVCLSTALAVLAWLSVRSDTALGLWQSHEQRFRGHFDLLCLGTRRDATLAAAVHLALCMAFALVGILVGQLPLILLVPVLWGAPFLFLGRRRHQVRPKQSSSHCNWNLGIQKESCKVWARVI